MELERRKNIVHKHLENPEWSGSKLAKVLKMPKTTVCRVLKTYMETLSVERNKRTYEKTGSRDRQLRSKVLRCVKANPGLSIRDVARRYNANFQTVRNILARGGYKSYKASKHPNRHMKQNSVAKKRARLLYDHVLTKHKGCTLMDDETYVKLDFKQLPGQKFYIATGRGDVPGRFKFVFADKFAKKAMIWQAICSCGLKTEPFVTSSTMTSQVYIEECLEKRLLPFIHKHRGKVIFWPDLASCHYSKVVLEWYAANKVDFVPKLMNPPNCPEFRPIEKYWAISKQKLRRSGGAVKDMQKMREKWKKCANSVSVSTVRELMGSIKKKVKDFVRTGEM